MSFANVQLYNAVIPSYSPKETTRNNEPDNSTLNGDDPTSQEAVNKALFDNEDE